MNWHQACDKINELKIELSKGADGQLVCLLVFKTSRGALTRPGWVRFPYAPARILRRNHDSGGSDCRRRYGGFRCFDVEIFIGGLYFIMVKSEKDVEEFLRQNQLPYSQGKTILGIVMPKAITYILGPVISSSCMTSGLTIR